MDSAIFYASLALFRRRMSAARSEQFSNDPEHPIPSLDVCDVHGKRKDGGYDLAIVIASPMDASPHSLLRVIQKIEGYLSFLSGLNQNPGPLAVYFTLLFISGVSVFLFPRTVV